MSVLFSRGDLVESAWKIAQPILDYWESKPSVNFPNYSRGSWGPKVAHDLIERDGRRWFEVVTPEQLQTTPLFENADPILLNAVIKALRPVAVEAGEIIISIGEVASNMFLICRGKVNVLNDSGELLHVLKDGDFFGEVGLLLGTKRTATIQAKMLCDMFVLDKKAFCSILREHPQFAEMLMMIAKERYNVDLSKRELMKLE